MIEKIIEEVRAFSEENNLPVMRKRTAALLASLVSAKAPARVLEIGTCTGVSGMTALAAGAKTLTTVEKDEPRAEMARKNFAKCGFSHNVTLIEEDCRKVLSYLDGNEYEIVVLDGPKSDLDFQYETCLNMLVKGGIIFIDDVNYHGMIKGEGAKHKHRTIITSMREFLKKLESDERVKVKIYDFDDGVAVVEKK